MDRPRMFKVEMPDNEKAIENLRLNTVLLGGKITEEPIKSTENNTDKDKKNWIIGVGGSIGDTVTTYRVYGTKKQVKRYLLNLIKEDKKDDIDIII